MSIAEEIERLQQLRERGALSEDEFQRAKARVLGAASTLGVPSEAHLRRIEAQNEVERLDREWEMERETYMVTGRYGSRSLPSEGGSIFGGVFVALFGGLWTMGAANAGAPTFFWLFGVFFVLMGVGSSIVSFNKAGAYREAHERYKRRRAELMSRNGLG